MAHIDFDSYLGDKTKNNKSLKNELEIASRAIDIAMQIYNLRKKSGLTQQELAEKIGISQSNIARLEDSDYKGYSLKTLEKIAKALEADVHIIITKKTDTNTILKNVYPHLAI